MIINGDTTELTSLTCYVEDHFDSFVNGGEDYDTDAGRVALITDYPVRVATTVDFGDNWNFYKVAHSLSEELEI